MSGGVGIYLLATSRDGPDSSTQTGLSVRPTVGNTSGSVDLTYTF